MEYELLRYELIEYGLLNDFVIKTSSCDGISIIYEITVTEDNSWIIRGIISKRLSFWVIGGAFIEKNNKEKRLSHYSPSVGDTINIHAMSIHILSEDKTTRIFINCTKSNIVNTTFEFVGMLTLLGLGGLLLNSISAVFS